MAGTIGIKIANGDFYPLMEENSPSKKRLVLTTVHDRQSSVQIDLFRSVSKTMLDAQYIGSMVVEKIPPKGEGDPSIEMVISSDKDGNITADACDLDLGKNGEHCTLSVSLKTLDAPVWKDDDFPDFDFEKNGSQSPAGLYGQGKERKDEERKFPWLIMLLATLFVALGIALIWFFFFGGREIICERTGRPPIDTSLPPPPLVRPETPPPPQVIEVPETPPPPPVTEVPEAPPVPPPVAEVPETPPEVQEEPSNS
jgi:hypothetical protein